MLPAAARTTADAFVASLFPPSLPTTHTHTHTHKDPPTAPKQEPLPPRTSAPQKSFRSGWSLRQHRGARPVVEVAVSPHRGRRLQEGKRTVTATLIEARPHPGSCRVNPKCLTTKRGALLLGNDI
ncbi:hypothetical protein E2C01_001838 [Portunus trituberculatus]|uniref:Uncharacterized protein n=1 Tax=Portunus trituberculatus TaxID=210409 RepID=A0A5B7CIY6_PORTR|nr:hypothetical protein [Portunus trituberculatus]